MAEGDAIQRTPNDANSGSARTRQHGWKHAGQRVRVAVTVEMRGANAGLHQRRKLRVALAAYLGGTHAANERTTSQRAERVKVTGARIGERRRMRERAAGDEIEVEADGEGRRALARESSRLGKGLPGDERRRRGERACRMRLEDTAVYAGREPEVVSVDDELASGDGHSVSSAGSMEGDSTGTGGT